MLNGNSESFTVEFAGPWWYLERLIYRQKWLFIKDPLVPSEPDPGDLPPIQPGEFPSMDGYTQTTETLANGSTIVVYTPQPISFTGETQLPFDSQMPPPPKNGYDIEAVSLPNGQIQYTYVPTRNDQMNIPFNNGEVDLSYTYIKRYCSLAFIGQGNNRTSSLLDGSAVIQLAIDYLNRKAPEVLSVGELPGGLVLPVTEFHSMPCAEVIKYVLRWAPNYSTWFDYSITPPRLHINKRSSKTKVTLNTDVDNIVNTSLASLPDQVLPGVTIEYVKRFEQPNGFGTSYWMQLDKAGPNPTGVGAVVLAFELNGGVADPDTGQWSDYGDAVPEGLAQQIYDGRKKLHYGGTIKLKDDDVKNLIWTSVRVNITGVDSEGAWADMDQDIQQSSEEIFSGETTLTLGPPDHLGPQDLKALLVAGRTVRYPPTTPPPASGPINSPPRTPRPAPPPKNQSPLPSRPDPHQGETDYDINATPGTLRRTNDQSHVNTILPGFGYTHPMVVIGAEEQAGQNLPPAQAGLGVAPLQETLPAPDARIYSSAISVGGKYYSVTVGIPGNSRQAMIAGATVQSAFLDLSNYSKLSYSSAKLIGVQRRTGYEDTYVELDITWALGNARNEIVPPTPVLGQQVYVNSDSGSLGGSNQKAGSLEFTKLRLTDMPLPTIPYT